MDNYHKNSLRNFFLQENMHDLARLVDNGTDPDTVGQLLLQKLLQEDQIYQDLLIRMGERDGAARAAYEQMLQFKEEQVMFHPSYQFFNGLFPQENPGLPEDCGCDSPGETTQSAKLRNDSELSESGPSKRVRNKGYKTSNTNNTMSGISKTSLGLSKTEGIAGRSKKG